MPTDDTIQVVGARENNLKDITVEIPKNKLVVFAGVSGSGKSSLLFETVARESNRQWQDGYPLFLRNKLPHYDRPDVEAIHYLPPSIVIDQKSIGRSSRSTVGTLMDLSPLLRLLFSRVGQPSAGGSMAYSPNHPAGMCQDCTGLGRQFILKEDLIFDKNKTLAEGAILFSQFSSGWQSHLYLNNPLLEADKPLSAFTEQEWQFLKYGNDETIKIGIRSNNTGRVDQVDYEGVIPRFYRLYLKRDISKLKKSLQEEVLALVEEGPCTTCQGTGLNPKALLSKINGHTILDYQNRPVEDVLPLLADLQDSVGMSIAKQIRKAIERMIDVGLGYLSLSRTSDSLSGGELQRVKLVRHLGASLSNVNYIFDEPAAGLHPYDIEKVSRLLLQLRDEYNNILVVEHHRQLIEQADYIIEMGPGAGQYGGQVIYEGRLLGLENLETATAKSLNQTVSLKLNPKQWTDSYPLEQVCNHNLKNISVALPKGVLTAITGVAGSGKSSLMQAFIERYPESIFVTQAPIGSSIRSTPATYTGIMDEIRRLFAKANGLTPSWFSFNSKGACPICKGSGRLVYDMAFADKVEVVCEECNGHRYAPEVLTYTYQEKNIEEVLALTVEEALEFFDTPKIQKALQRLLNVGLGYISLGQATSSLSGGEIQRLKLANYLQTTGEIFILDEPSTGLHDKDLQGLLTLFNQLISQGNTLIIIEHRLELIAQADWLIDMGPSGGSQGGEIVFQGIPADAVNEIQSKTGLYLKKLIERTLRD